MPKWRFRDPADDLNVAQAAGPFLDIRLEVIGGIVKAQMTVVLFFEFGFEELSRRPDLVWADRLLEFVVELAAADDQARFDHRRDHRDIGFAFAHAIANGAHAVADFEADIPEEGQERRKLILLRAIGFALEQDHQIDIRTR